MKLFQTLFILALFFSHQVTASELQRRANWGASFSFPSQLSAGVIIKSIKPESPLFAAGLKVGDHITRINGMNIPNSEIWYDISSSLISNKEYRLDFNRDSVHSSLTVKFGPQVKEQHEGLETIYTQLTNDFGIKQRVIITKPISKKDKHPAILLLQGLSCSSIEINRNRMTPWTRLINEIVEKSDHVVLRIEKPGLGDSEGNCSQTDFRTELNGYEAAAKLIKTIPYVDTNKIIVYGNSMGSALAPYFANKYKFSGVISDGTFVKSWFEHMLEIERRILEFKGNTQSQITTKMNQSYFPLYYGMLIQKKSYEEILNESPAIKKDNYHGPNHMYGRPMKYYQQLQEFDFTGAWQKLKAPARIRWGTNDWIMSESDNDMIIDILNKSGHKDHKLLKHKDLDHWQAFHETPKNSFEGKKGLWKDEISQVIIDWIGEINSQ